MTQVIIQGINCFPRKVKVSSGFGSVQINPLFSRKWNKLLELILQHSFKFKKSKIETEL